MELSLKADLRDITGKNVGSLRRRGITPLHLFGNGVESLALQAETAKVEKSLSQAGETRLISLGVGSERKPRPVLVRGVQRDPISRQLLHVDLYQVNMSQRVEAEVPIVLVGQASALQSKGVTVLQQLDSLAVECLPDSIPGRLEVDISSLTDAGQVKRVKDIKVDQDIAVSTDPEQVVAIVVARAEEKGAERTVTAETPAASSQAQPPPKDSKEEA